MIKMKQCTKCNQTLNYTEYNRDVKNKDKLRCSCRKCQKIAQRKYRENNKSNVKASRIKYWNKNKKNILNKRHEKQKNLSEQEQTRIKEKSRAYYITNRDKILANTRKYQKKNKDKIRKRRKVRYNNDINYKISLNLRNRLNIAIKNGYKAGSAVTNLGVSIDELKLYLEKQFRPGMTWQNHGKWHIDHIKPLSSFDLADKTQFLMACHYSNLQPMWAKDNLKKGNK